MSRSPLVTKGGTVARFSPPIAAPSCDSLTLPGGGPVFCCFPGGAYNAGSQKRAAWVQLQPQLIFRGGLLRTEDICFQERRLNYYVNRYTPCGQPRRRRGLKGIQ